MQYSLLPFPSHRDAGGPDVREQLRVRKENNPTDALGIDNLELLDETVDLLRDVPWEIQVDHCVESDGNLRLAVVATDLGRDVEAGDTVKAGFYLANSESSAFETVACVRIHRVVCENGQIVECEEGQTMVVASKPDEEVAWREKLPDVIARCFDADGLDRDLARFRATLNQMLMTPYELLCNLVASGIITEDEQSDIQRGFDDVGDYTTYGLINAVTSAARRLRDYDDWRRSFELERLAGEILRGDHQPPILDPVYQ